MRRVDEYRICLEFYCQERIMKMVGERKVRMMDVIWYYLQSHSLQYKEDGLAYEGNNVPDLISLPKKASDNNGAKVS